MIFYLTKLLFLERHTLINDKTKVMNKYYQILKAFSEIKILLYNKVFSFSIYLFYFL